MSEGNHGTKLYYVIGGSLLLLTVVTVLASYIELSLPMTITLALIIATFKASLVACYFMHLLEEKQFIYIVLALTVIGFFICLFVPLLTEMSRYGTGWTPL